MPAVPAMRLGTVGSVPRFEGRPFPHRGRSVISRSDLDELVATGRVKAARYARVDTLFLAGNAHLWGWFDESEDRVIAYGSAAEGDIDLLDFAALMTFRQGGTVMLVARETLPPLGLSAAILRY
jgi:hypothetical protein